MNAAMDRAQRVAELWNWLPAFRVVAEYGSIQRAALVLHVSPSALSRTIRLLEENVGAPLFLRSATGLTVTAEGVELLKGTRDAMRRMDDVLEKAHAHGSSERLRIAAEGSVLMRFAARAAAKMPIEKDVRLMAVDCDTLEGELLRGNIDVALALGRSLDASPVSRDLISTKIGGLAFAIHDPSHVANEPGVSVDARRSIVILEEHSRDAITVELGHLRVAAVCASIDAVETLAREASFLALLPRSLATPPFRPHAPSALFEDSVIAITRRPVRVGEGEPSTETSIEDLFLIALRKLADDR